jgi:hypothetical protein
MGKPASKMPATTAIHLYFINAPNADDPFDRNLASASATTRKKEVQKVSAAHKFIVENS